MPTVGSAFSYDDDNEHHRRSPHRPCGVRCRCVCFRCGRCRRCRRRHCCHHCCDQYDDDGDIRRYWDGYKL